MWPAFSAANSLVPSAETATELQCARSVLVGCQDPPASVERYTWPSAVAPPLAAMRVRPSAEEATLTQLVIGAVAGAQFNPELVEMKIEPLPEPVP